MFSSTPTQNLKASLTNLPPSRLISCRNSRLLTCWCPLDDVLVPQAVKPLLIPFFCLSALLVERWLGNTVLSTIGRMAAFLTCQGKIATKKVKFLRWIYVSSNFFAKQALGNRRSLSPPIAGVVVRISPLLEHRLTTYYLLIFCLFSPVFNAAFVCSCLLHRKQLESLCNTISVTYSRAVVRGIMRGLPSYNILLNPK